MTDPVYYSKETLFIDNNDTILGAAAAGFFQTMQNLISGASPGTQTLYFLVSSVGQASTIVSYDLIFDGSGNAQYVDENGALSQLYDATATNALTAGILSTLGALGVVLTGAEIITAAIGVTGLYSVATDLSNLPYYETVSGTVDEEFKFLDSNGNVISGVLYKDGLVNSNDSASAQLSSAIQGLLTNANVTPGASLQDGFVIEYYDGGVVAEQFTLLDGQNIDDLAAFMGFTADGLFTANFPATPAEWFKQGSELDFDLYFSDNGNSWVIARASDLLGVDLNQNDLFIDRSYFHPSDILTGQATQFGDDDNTLIIGTQDDDTTLASAGGNDYIFGWDGNDRLIGGSGNDNVFGGQGDDTLIGHATFDGQGGVIDGLDGDSYFGGDFDSRGTADGADTIDYSGLTTGVKIDLTNTNAAVGGFGFARDASGNTFGSVDRLLSIENAIGTNADDKITGNDADNILNGNAGDDLLIGGAGNDTLNGGAGFDVLDYSQDAANGGTNAINLDLINSTVTDGYGDTDSFLGIENVILSSGDDTVSARYADGGKIIDGGAGFDTISYEYPITIDFRENDPVVWRGDFRDEIISFEKIETGINPFFGYASRIIVDETVTNLNNLPVFHQNGPWVGGSQPYWYDPNGYSTNAGIGELDYSTVSGPLTFDVRWNHDDTLFTDFHLATVTGAGLSHSYLQVPIVYGSNYGDTYVAQWYVQNTTSHTNEFYTGTGNDTFNLVSTNDHNFANHTIHYSGGHDVYDIAEGTQIILAPTIFLEDITVSSLTTHDDDYGFDAVLNIEGHGSITLHYDEHPLYTQTIELEAGGLISISNSVVNSEFTGFQATFSGASTMPAVLLGSWGHDSWTGRTGYDETYAGLGGNDIIDAADGDDALYGGDGDDILNGGVDNDQLFGGAGNDILRGQSGDDIITGGSENDTAIFSGFFANYTITTNNTGVLTVVDNVGSDGTDTVQTDVEKLRFTDGIYESGALTANNVPVASNDNAITDEAEAVNIDVLSNDTDSDNETLNVLTVVNANNGTAFVNASGTITYTPNAGFTGSDSFSYTISDGNGGTDTASVSLTVNPSSGNNVPIAIDDIATTDENVALNINVLANDSDPDGDILFVLNVGTATNGIASIGAANTVAYTPNAGFVGNDSFTYTISDGHFGNSTASVNVSVNAAGTTTLLGTPGDDPSSYFPSTNASEIIDGLAGNDVIVGNGGHDTLIGGLGNDTLIGADNSDDILHGDEGNDLLKGYGGNDQLFGGDGNDTNLWGYAGNDILNGGLGDDTVRYDNDPNVIQIDLATGTGLDGYGGTDQLIDVEDVIGSGHSDTISGDAQDNFLRGLNGNDTISGAGGNDELRGDAGDDILKGDAGDDIIKGGSGTDEAHFSGDFTDYTFSVQSTYTFVTDNVGNDGTDRVHDDVEIMRFADGIYAGGTFTTIIGNQTPIARDDLYTGNQDQDVLGNVLTNSNPNGADSDPDGDPLSVSTGTFATEQGGSITLLADGSFTYTPSSGFSGQDRYEYTLIDGQGGSDMAFVTFDLSPTLSITGTNNAETITGTLATEIISGLGGNDVIIGNGGNDTIYGGDGDDILYGTDNSDDKLYGGEGNDTLKGYGGDDQLFGDGGSDTNLWGHAGNDLIVGGDGDGDSVRYISDPSGVTIDLYAGTAIDGWGDTDSIQSVEDAMGSAFDDTIIGDASANEFRGLDGNDILKGGDNNDYMKGDNGNDTLYGQDGLDQLFGNAGADTFVFEAASAFNDIDNVRDFSIADGDMINIADLLIGYDPITDAISNFVQITDTGSNSSVAVDADGGANNFIQIATLTGITGLTDAQALENSGTLVSV